MLGPTALHYKGASMGAGRSNLHAIVFPKVRICVVPLESTRSFPRHLVWACWRFAYLVLRSR